MKEYYNERNLKKLVPLNERLQMIASANSDGREWAKKLEEEKTWSGGHNFGQYNKREFNYECTMEVGTDDDIVDRAFNTLLVAFVVGDRTKTYSTRDAEKEVLQHRNEEQLQLYWNGNEVDMESVTFKTLKGDNDYYFYESSMLQVDGKGYEGETIAFYRLGDYLTKEEIRRTFKYCEQFKHAAPVFLATFCAHRLVEKAATDKVKNEHQCTRHPAKVRKIVDRTIKRVTNLLLKIRDKMTPCYDIFNMTDFVRCAWESWTYTVPRHDEYYGYLIKQARLKRRKETIRVMRIDGHTYPDSTDDGKLLEEVRLLHAYMIMLISQQSTDAVTESMFGLISHNFTTAGSYLQPLMMMSWCNLFEVYTEVLRSSALYTQKAACLLNSFAIIEVLYDGKVPRDYDTIRLFRQMGPKKSIVTLSVLGGYNKQIGIDTHVNSLIRACGQNQLKDEEVFYVSWNLPEDPGAYANNVSGEIRQAYEDKRKATWSKWKGTLY